MSFRVGPLPMNHLTGPGRFSLDTEQASEMFCPRIAKTNRGCTTSTSGKTDAKWLVQLLPAHLGGSSAHEFG